MLLQQNFILLTFPRRITSTVASTISFLNLSVLDKFSENEYGKISPFLYCDFRITPALAAIFSTISSTPCISISPTRHSHDTHFQRRYFTSVANPQQSQNPCASVADTLEETNGRFLVHNERNKRDNPTFRVP